MVGFNINDFFFKKKNKHHAPIIISIDYGFSFFLYILCLFICFGFFFYNEFLNLFDYPTNVFYPDQGEVIVRVLYYGK